MPPRAGRLFGLGVGPGDPELVTLKTLRLLRGAAVIAYPAPEDGESLARSIVAAWLDGTRPEIAIRFPMRPGPPPVAIYDAAAARLSAELEEVLGIGDRVGVICEGRIVGITDRADVDIVRLVLLMAGSSIAHATEPGEAFAA